ncbi:MAG: hypothetical protein EBR10_07705 [Planctomycetes bacterium]|nr:hypothetical protein [Planctomycetota bacterium]
MIERTAVISQPMFIPWLGLFEQIRLADDFVHYDDVQIPQGRSFITRVQVKTAQGVTWLTAPVDHAHSGRTIRETRLGPAARWRPKHLKTIRQALARTPHAETAISLAEQIYATSSDNLAEFNIAALEIIARWLGLKAQFSCSSALGVQGSSSQRLLTLCERLGATQYVTGHGAFQYLDHALFESKGVRVRYMLYERRPYPQPHGAFTPYVTILDAIACCGSSIRDLMVSESVDWRMHVSASI